MHRTTSVKRKCLFLLKNLTAMVTFQKVPLNFRRFDIFAGNFRTILFLLISDKIRTKLSQISLKRVNTREEKK